MSFAIERVTVIGSGAMGGALAAHCANAGLAVSLLDIVPARLTDAQAKKKLTLDMPAVRNSIVNAGLDAVKKAKPAALFTPQTAERIRVGNLEDNFDEVARADWVLEAIVEDLALKRALMERIDGARKPSSIVT